jgi:hypothetical protein
MGYARLLGRLARNRIALRWVAVPTPADPKLIPPAFALASATKSATVLNPRARETTSTFGTIPRGTTAAKSFAAS